MSLSGVTAGVTAVLGYGAGTPPKPEIMDSVGLTISIALLTFEPPNTKIHIDTTSRTIVFDPPEHLQGVKRGLLSKEAKNLGELQPHLIVALDILLNRQTPDESEQNRHTRSKRRIVELVEQAVKEQLLPHYKNVVQEKNTARIHMLEHWTTLCSNGKIEPQPASEKPEDLLVRQLWSDTELSLVADLFDGALKLRGDQKPHQYKVDMIKLLVTGKAEELQHSCGHPPAARRADEPAAPPPAAAAPSSSGEPAAPQDEATQRQLAEEAQRANAERLKALADAKRGKKRG